MKRKADLRMGSITARIGRGIRASTIKAASRSTSGPALVGQGINAAHTRAEA